MLQQKSQIVLDMQKKRALDFKQKNEMALARARENDTRLMAQRHQTIAERQRQEREHDKKLSQDRIRKSQERAQMAHERSRHIQKTKNEAESRLNQKVSSTMDLIERKRQQELSLKARQEEKNKKQAMDQMQRW